MISRREEPAFFDLDPILAGHNRDFLGTYFTCSSVEGTKLRDLT